MALLDFHYRDERNRRSEFQQLFGIAGQQGHGQVGEDSFAVLVVDAPDAVELGVGPLVGWGCTESGGEFGQFAVVPGDEDDLAGVLAAEQELGETGVVVVGEVGVDGEVEGLDKEGEAEGTFEGLDVVGARLG